MLGRGGVGGFGCSIEPPKLKQLTLKTYTKNITGTQSFLRVRVQKNQKLSGKFQNFKTVQTLAFSGPY